MLILASFTWNFMVIRFFCICKRMLVGFLFWDFWIFVEFVNSLKRTVSPHFNICIEANFWFFKKPEIVTSSIWKSSTNYCVIRFIANNLWFYCMVIFLSGVREFLPLLGRSIGVSVASIHTTSNLYFASKTLFSTVDGKSHL